MSLSSLHVFASSGLQTVFNWSLKADFKQSSMLRVWGVGSVGWSDTILSLRDNRRSLMYFVLLLVIWLKMWMTLLLSTSFLLTSKQIKHIKRHLSFLSFMYF